MRVDIAAVRTRVVGSPEAAGSLRSCWNLASSIFGVSGDGQGGHWRAFVLLYIGGSPQDLRGTQEDHTRDASSVPCRATVDDCVLN